MAIYTDTPLQAAQMISMLPGRGWCLSVVAKLTARLVADGEVELLDEQPPLSGECYVDDDTAMPLLQATDCVACKPQGEFLFQGSCHVAEAVQETEVTVQVGSLSKTVKVSGDRQWQKKLLGSQLGPAATFTEMPIGFAQAFGGPELAHNPHGKGYKDLAEQAPNLEYPSKVQRKMGEVVPVATFGPRPFTHPHRVQKMGQFSEAWLADGWPALPGEADLTCLLSAAPDQHHAGYFRGDEQISLTRLTASSEVLTTRLPGLKPRCFCAAYGKVDEAEEIDLQLDTISIDGEQETVSLVWRGVIEVPVPEQAPAYDQLLVLERKTDRAGSLADYREQFADQARPHEAVREQTGEVVAAGVAEAPTLTERTWTRAAVEAELAAGRDFSFADLQGVDVRGLDFSAAVLHAAKLIGADLDGCTFSGALLAEADLSACRAAGVSFTGAEAHASRWDGAELAGADLSGVDASFASCKAIQAKGAQASGIVLYQADLSEAVIDLADLSKADLSACNCTKLSAVDARLDGAFLYRCQLTMADCSRAQLTGLQAATCQAQRARFHAVEAPESVWTGSDLSGADFSRSNLHRALFDGCVLTDAKLSGVDLRQGMLAGSRLTGADLHAADLAQTPCERVDAANADFSDCNLFEVAGHQAVTEGARFGGARRERSTLGT